MNPSAIPKLDHAAFDEQKAHEFGARAMALLSEHKISPVPENYTIFFLYASGIEPELTHEIDAAIANRMPFSTHMLKNLYHRYSLPDKNERVIHDVSTGANQLLGDVLRVVGDFSKETTSYNQDIDGYMQKISVDIDDKGVQALVKDLISATAEMKERGESLTNKLEESRKEVESLKKNLDQLTQESQRDFLTGIFNRKALDRLLAEQVMQHAEGSGAELCVLMLDVDHFKQFNDKHGHLLGDEVLKIVARAITYCVRGKDIVARYGGEEFCVVLPNTPMTGATKVAETIRKTIASRDLKRKDTGASYGTITVSVGVSQLRYSDTVESVLKRADEALYKSKHTGRNRVSTETD